MDDHKQELENVLADVAAKRGGELIVESSGRTLGPIPLPHAGFVNGRCPRCGGEQFWHSFGDELCRCDGCGAELDVDELEDPDPDPSFPQPARPGE
jgi:hypothetical protein